MYGCIYIDFIRYLRPVESIGISHTYLVDGQPALHAVAKLLETNPGICHKILNQLSRVDGRKTPVAVL